MNVQEIYKQRLMSAEEAVKKVNSNDLVVLSCGVGAPPGLLEALAANAENYQELRLVQAMGVQPNRYFMEENMEGHFVKVSTYHTLWDRIAEKKKLSTIRYNCVNISEAAKHVTQINPTCYMGAVSPMDKWGYFSLGTSVLYEMDTCELAHKIILEVNENLPRTRGDCFIHISQVDAIVENNVPLVEIPNLEASENDKAIAENIIDMVPDRATVQLGVGSLPNTIAQFLFKHKDLGVHTELITENYMELWKAGVINCRYKPFFKNKMVGCLVLGSRKFYEFLDDNPCVELHRGSWTNNPSVIAQHPNVISINGTLQVDICGQCCSDSLGTDQFSGVAGQVDWVRGAQMSPGGKSFLCLHSTAKNDTISRIVPMISDGSYVTTTRNDVEYIATEYGVARLKDKPMDERARLMIQLAHPKFRDWLTEEARRMRIIR